MNIVLGNLLALIVLVLALVLLLWARKAILRRRRAADEARFKRTGGVVAVYGHQPEEKLEPTLSAGSAASLFTHNLPDSLAGFAPATGVVLEEAFSGWTTGTHPYARRSYANGGYVGISGYIPESGHDGRN